MLQAGPCTVVQKRVRTKDGYDAVQVGFDPIVKKRGAIKPVAGHFKKAGVAPQRVLREFRGMAPGEFELGQEIKADVFKVGEMVDVVGVSKGKGFQGGVKRHGFRGGAGLARLDVPPRPRLDRGLLVPVAGLPRPAAARPHGRRPGDGEAPRRGRRRPGPRAAPREGRRPRGSPRDRSHHREALGTQGRYVMANTDLYNAKNEKVGEVELPGGLFGGRISQALLHEVSSITAANERTGTRATKGRGAVSGGGRKPWKQKGTGRARQGSTRSPQWRHGGIVFGPLPKDYDVRLPQSKRRAAMRAALAWKLRDGLVHVIEEFPETGGKAKVVRGLARADRLARRRRARPAHRRRPGAGARRQQPPRRQGRAARRLRPQRPRGLSPPRADARGPGRDGGTMGKVNDPYRIIRKPLLTEKCHDLKEKHNQVAFRVDPTATKSDIKAAVERIFKAKVAAVNTVNITGKEKRLGKNIGRRSDWKKAIVTLKPGEKIEIIEGVS